MGWLTCHSGQKIQKIPSPTREWCSPLHGLAKATKLCQYQAWPQAFLLGMWFSLSWSSWMSLGAESVRHLPLTIQICRKTYYEKQDSCKSIYISSSQASTLASLSVFPLSPTCNWHLLHCLLTYSSTSTRLSTGYKRYCGGLPHHSTPSLTMAIYSCTTGRQLIFHWYITVLQVKPISWNVQFNLECHLRHSAVPRHQAYIQLGGWLPPLLDLVPVSSRIQLEIQDIE